MSVVIAPTYDGRVKSNKTLPPAIAGFRACERRGRVDRRDRAVQVATLDEPRTMLHPSS